MRIDAHHHLWHYTTAEYGWIDDTMQPLRRDFLPADLVEACAAAHVDATIAVQARQTLEETHWLLALATENPLIRGVVGWADIAAADLPATLEPLLANPHLKGLRHIVQAEPDGFLDDPAFNRGIEALTRTGLTYDILIFARQLPEATRFVDRHPTQSFVLDHIAKPSIASGEIAHWSASIHELARRPNVTCKLSGMVTEANWHTWTPSTLKPYFDVALEAFGPTRLMAGSDWPVLNVASTYTQWWQTLDTWLAPLSPDERVQIEGRTAARVYHL
ncbi:amidohydrolase family protein [Granulicella sp. 5B5]|uniref:amidohydrolase family protein n=1 Tax=Granulicella sp. 5B5 TaxID=1617967 RepID=UPI002103D751|nr:amidohydrolase family protein [Granulicella sp. 5B5]